MRVKEAGRSRQSRVPDRVGTLQKYYKNVTCEIQRTC